MQDFSRRYRGVAHFGLWAEEGADRLGDRDAWEILVDAARRCRDEDVRTMIVIDAIGWFERKAVRPRAARDFRCALDLPCAAERYQAAFHALTRLGRVAGIIDL